MKMKTQRDHAKEIDQLEAKAYEIEIGIGNTDELEGQCDDLRKRFDQVVIDYGQAVNEQESVPTALRYLSTAAMTGTQTPRPSLSLSDARKPSKMPDALMLDDGKTVKFKTWKNKIRTKLLLNDDHYPTMAHKLAYTRSRCIGKALRHIGPCMHLEATYAYKSVDNVARDQYLELKMNHRQDFTDFLAEFTSLAEESEQPEELRKRDLYRKLPTLLQK
ncbi:uncharacterized protein N7482_010759 [Penicillium canariense]|uniref:Uncharacterized protein n=1 Tax=Penicillium canariense TaxID=189055 RepID=A0A9W9LEN2_9EURO|nr:uncharacterized protein N7482_010759 [Penicillium canariense]KAJ5151507.1 hypothetical protein N7482_010759 [Penicillium canariense]